MKTFFLAVILLLASNSPVLAHPGRTAADGCHVCKTNCDKWGVAWNERHCHGGYTAPVVKTSTPTPFLPTTTYAPTPTKVPSATTQPTVTPTQKTTTLPATSTPTKKPSLTPTDTPKPTVTKAIKTPTPTTKPKVTTSPSFMTRFFGWLFKR